MLFFTYRSYWSLLTTYCKFRANKSELNSRWALMLGLTFLKINWMLLMMWFRCCITLVYCNDSSYFQYINIQTWWWLHNYRIDDIQDNSILRRGIPVAHSIFGVASTINASNYVYFLGLEKVLGLNHPEVCFIISFIPLNSLHGISYLWKQATKIFCEQLLELHRGQGMEIYWRDSYICPTEEEYKDMIIKSKPPTMYDYHRHSENFLFHPFQKQEVSLGWLLGWCNCSAPTPKIWILWWLH